MSRNLVDPGRGYHYRFVGAFQEAARVVRSGALGTIHHVRAEAYGPAVLRTKVTVWGISCRVSADRQECRIDLRDAAPGPPDSVFRRSVSDHFGDVTGGRLATA